MPRFLYHAFLGIQQQVVSNRSERLIADAATHVCNILFQICLVKRGMQGGGTVLSS